MGERAKGRHTWWGEDFGELSRVAPERSRGFRGVYGLSGVTVGNADMRAEPLNPRRANIEKRPWDGDS
jgi:hypothetical protein